MKRKISPFFPFQIPSLKKKKKKKFYHESKHTIFLLRLLSSSSFCAKEMETFALHSIMPLNFCHISNTQIFTVIFDPCTKSRKKERIEAAYQTGDGKSG